jgi:sugar (pentulose or hexulose) kinase
MSSSETIWLIDVGTSSLKSTIVDRQYRVKAKFSRTYPCKVVPDMGVEIDPELIWQTLVDCATEFASFKTHLSLIALCTFCPALTPMDQHGRALRNSIIHLDRRSYKQARNALQLFGRDNFLRITGNLPYPGGISLTSLLWIKEREPDIFTSAVQFGHMNTFLLKRLTGRWLMDPTNASMTGLYETVSQGGWNLEIADAFGIDRDKLPEVVWCDERVGGLTRSAASQLGLRTGTPLIMGGGDTACATYGAGGLGEGEILNISGSNEILTVTMKRPFADKKHNLRTHVVKDRWIAFVITVSGIALEWFRTQFCLDMSENIFYQDFLPAALADASTFDVRYAPYLSGDRYSMVQRRGAFTGLTLNTTRKKILRSMVDGNTQQMYKLLSKLEEQITLQNKISLTGGATGGAITEYKARTWFKGYQLVEKEDCTLKGLFKLTSKSR